MKKLKIGELVNFNEDITELTVEGESITIKKGDYGVVTSDKNVLVLTGEASNMDVHIKDADVEGYDIPSMAATIHLGLESAYRIDKAIEKDHLLGNLEVILKKIFR